MINKVILCLRFTQVLGPIDIVVLQAAICYLLRDNTPTIHQGPCSITELSWQITMPELSDPVARQRLTKLADQLNHPDKWLEETVTDKMPHLQAACLMTETDLFTDAYSALTTIFKEAFVLAPPERKAKRRGGTW